MQSGKQAVEQAVPAEDGDPGKSAYDGVGKQRKQNDRVQNLSAPLVQHGKIVGSGQSEDDTAKRGDQGKAKGTVEDPAVELIGEEAKVVSESERGSGEGREDGDDHR